MLVSGRVIPIHCDAGGTKVVIHFGRTWGKMAG